MANTTFLGTVSGVGIDHSTTLSQSFVFNKSLELPERPFMHPFVMPCLTSSDISQIFHDHNTTWFDSIDYSLTDIVVSPSHEPCPSATELFKQSSSRPCAFSLQFANKPISAYSLLLDIAAIKLNCGSCSERIYSAINTKNSILENRAIGIDCFGEYEQEEASTLLIHTEQAFTELAINMLCIVLRDANLELLPAFDSSQTECVVLERSRPREVVFHEQFIDNRLGFSLFYHTTRLLDASNSQLALQAHLTQSDVDQGLELDIIAYPLLPCSIDTVLHTFLIYFECPNYLWCSSNLDFYCGSVLHIIEREEQINKHFGNEEQKDCTGFLPTLKSGASALTSL
jgi:hypothetical protein